MTEKTAAKWAEMNDPVIVSFRAKGGHTRRKHPVEIPGVVFDRVD